MSSEVTRDGFLSSVVRREVYNIVVAAGALNRLGEISRELTERLDARSIVVVTDTRVAELHLGAALNALDVLDLPVTTISIPPGEHSKSTERLLELWQRMLQGETERRTAVIALGGGVICDLVGFTAATYMRGIPYVNVPTSLMAQVDAAIGGKVAVDDPRAKNLLGAFYHPSLVVVDPAVLDTLPPCELANGLAEVVKVAVISSEPLMAALESGGHEQPGELEAIVRESIGIKLALLSEDPFEADLRRLLNFGHCVGHPLEAASGYTLRHGEAVSIGMVIAAEVARQRRLCSARTADRIYRVLRRNGLPVRFPAELTDAVWENMKIVRRIRNGRFNLVVPAEIGRCEILPSIHYTEYRDAITANSWR